MILEVLLAMTLWAECRGEPLEGKMAVASVIVNRASRRGTDYHTEIMRPYQFSCWNGYRGKHKMMQAYNSGQMIGPAWEECKLVARMMMDGSLPKTKWNHYHNPDKCNPKQAKEYKNKKIIGHHLFGRIGK